MRLSYLVFCIALASTVRAQNADSIWSKSIDCYNSKDYHGVIENLDDFLRLLPENADALHNRAVARILLGNMKGACEDFHHAASINPDNNTSYIDYYCDPAATRDFLIDYAYPGQEVYAENGYRPRYTRADSLRGALRPERTCFDVYFYDLSVKIIPKGKKIKGKNDLYFRIIHPSRVIQIDLFANLAIQDIIWNNISLKWTREFNAVFVEFPDTLRTNEHHMITVLYKGKPVIAENPPWQGGFVWDRDENNNDWIGVACEHLGASSWWPNKDHLTDKPDSMRINLEVPKGYQVVSNGNLKELITDQRKYDEFKWFVSYPINNYNATFYIGHYTSFHDSMRIGEKTLRFDYNVLSYNLQKAKEHFSQTKDVVSFYCDAFGFYPFEKDGFGLVESPYEGMEHQSAIAYGNGYENNNDYVYRNGEYDFIIVHEAAHEWWGNSVTAADMADIWIHEGFATYAECLFIEHMFGYDEYMYELTEKSKQIFDVWPLVQHRDVNENTFAGNDVYNKGAVLLHCLRCTIDNDSVFFGMLRDFCVSHKYQVVTTNDFISFVNAYTQQNYSPLFGKFLYETGMPLLAYQFYRDGNDIVLKYKWTEVENGFTMPFSIETDAKKCVRLAANTSVKEVRLTDTDFFNFYNLFKGYTGSAKNSFTYFHTNWEEKLD